jgi:hypothetical protein
VNIRIYTYSGIETFDGGSRSMFRGGHDIATVAENGGVIAIRMDKLF